MHPRPHHQQNDAPNQRNGEHRQDEKVKQRIPSCVLRKILRRRIGHLRTPLENRPIFAHLRTRCAQPISLKANETSRQLRPSQPRLTDISAGLILVGRAPSYSPYEDLP